jgi:hypothetical protein
MGQWRDLLEVYFRVVGIGRHHPVVHSSPGAARIHSDKGANTQIVRRD